MLHERRSLDETYHAIEVSSRYNLESEIFIIKRAIDLIDISDRFAIHSIWCDSKACAVYSIELCKGYEAGRLLRDFDDVFRRANHGHNGIFVEQAGKTSFIGPWWPEDEN